MAGGELQGRQPGGGGGGVAVGLSRGAGVGGSGVRQTGIERPLVQIPGSRARCRALGLTCLTLERPCHVAGAHLGSATKPRAWVPARDGDRGSPRTRPIFLLVEVLPPEAGRFAEAGPWLCGFEFAYCAVVSPCGAKSHILSLASCVLPGACPRKEDRTSFIFKKKLGS